MSYESMTIAQLRGVAKDRGIALGKSMKKAEIVQVLEDADAGVQPVEAEVIEDEPNGIAVSLLPGTLHADFAALDSRIDAILADYEGWEPSADTADELRQIANERKYLNGIARELDERRKDIKREYTRPLDELERMFNARRDRIKAVVARLQAVEKEADEERKAAKESELREHYVAVAGLLADVVPYEVVADPKWLNKQPNIETCKRELEGRCLKAASDWETLKGLNLEYADEAELRFFQTLDLGEATAYATKLAEDKRRLDAMKAEREQYMQANEPQPAYEPMPAPAEPIPAQPAPVAAAPAPEEQPAPVESLRASYERRLIEALGSHEDWHVQKLADALENVAVSPLNPPQPRVMVIDGATVEQLQSIGKMCAVLGVTGVFKSGTLQQVYERSIQEGTVM